MKKVKLKKWGYIFLAFFLMLISFIYFCNSAIENAARGKLYSDTNTIPYNKVALVLGTSKYLSKNKINPFYTYRIQAAVELFRSGKIKYLIVSGDNGRREYNEPEMIRADLMLAGVDSSRIFLDYAGFRTFDSVVRLKEVFGQDSVTIISQPFHNPRALYIAQREGIYAIGFNAMDVSVSQGIRTRVREILARVKVFVDYLFGKKPKYLGKKIILPI
jgi:SanA protein